MAKKKRSKTRNQSEEHGTKSSSSAWDEAKKLWKDTEAASFENPPDNTYQGMFKKPSAGLSSNDRLQITFPIEIVSGDFSGRNVTKYSGLNTADSIGFTKADLNKLGHVLVDLDDLDEILEALDESYVSFSLKTPKDSDFAKIRFIKALDEDDIEEVDDLDAEETEEEVETKEEEEEEAEDITLEFDDDDISEADIKKISKLAEELSYDSDEYDTWTDLLQTIAEETEEISGEFDSPAKLIKAIRKVQ